MESVQSETFMSLADLAGMNTDQIQTLLSRVPNAGIYRVRGTEVKGSESEPTDGKPPLIRYGYKYEVISCQPTDKNVDPETLVGRVLNESYTLWPKQLVELIGLLKGRYQKVGLPNTGMNIGGVEGKEPGWLDTVVGYEFDLRIRTATKDGETRAYFDWMPPAKNAAPTEEPTQVATTTAAA